MRFLILSALAVGMLFASCKPDGGRGMRGKAGFILENGARWCMIDSIGETYYRMHENLVMGDTLIEGTRWKAVRKFSITERDFVFDCWMRQEGERVYRYDIPSGKAVLVYDFDVQEGDCVVSQSMEGVMEFTVTEVRDTVLPGGDGGRFRYVALCAGEYRDVWVESMGSLRTGFYTIGKTDMEGIFFEKVPGAFLYENPEYSIVNSKWDMHKQ